MMVCFRRGKVNEKKIGNYTLADKISQTHGAYLYKAQSVNDMDSEEDYFYAVKEYYNEIIPIDTLEREKRISHEIENYAERSIVIPILEVLKEEKKEYAVMQFRKNGLFLNELIEKLELQYGKGNIPIEIILEVIREILESLQVLHSFGSQEKKKGYLHLDLHPGNIFFESANMEKKEVGKAKFIDFLSALKLEGNSLVLDEDVMLATTSEYASPEQKEQEYEIYRPATDIYSVGAILFRMLTGETRTDDGKLEKKSFFTKIIGVTTDAILKYMLCTLIDCSMELNPMYRYSSAKDMLCSIQKVKSYQEAYQKQAYYTMYSIAYEMVIPKETVEAFEEINIREFRTSVTSLENDMIQNRIFIIKTNYLFACLYKCMEKQKEKIPYDIQFKLYKSGIACYNHMGKSLCAKQLYEEIEKIKGAVPLMEYFGCLSRVAVSYADLYEFEEAYEIVCRTVKSLEAVKEIYKQEALQNGIVSTAESARIIDLARAYSAKGTYIVFAKKGNPMPEFEKALEEFGGSIGNKMITISHILQYAMEIQDKELYEKYSEQYFDAYDTLTQGLILASEEKNFQPYKLLAFLKGTYIFYRDKIDSTFQQKLIELMDVEWISKLYEHPVQLIYRYIGLILYDYKEDMSMEAERAFLAAMTCLKEGTINLNEPINIMMCMNYQTMWLYNQLTKQEEENKELLELMMEHCKQSGWEKLYQALEETQNIWAALRYENC